MAPALLITAGGSGAGKTTTLTAERVALYDAVYDTVLTSFGSAKKIINRARRHGWHVDVHYVYRPFENAVEGIIERTRQIGRAVSLVDLPKVHLDAQRSTTRLQQHYASDDAVQVAGLLNAPGCPELIEMSRIKPGGDLHHTDMN